MTKWILVERLPERPLEKGLISIDLTFSGAQPLTLRYSAVVALMRLLDDMIEGVKNEEESEFSYARTTDAYILIHDNASIALLSSDDVGLLRNQLKTLLGGRAP